LLESGLDEPVVSLPGQPALSPELQKSKIENQTIRYFGDYELLEEIGRAAWAWSIARDTSASIALSR
jgi:hypothetical protein